MTDFRIGPMILRHTPSSIGYFLYRELEPCGYFRDEMEGRVMAIALSYVSDADWADAKRQHLTIRNQEATELRAA